MQLRGELKKLFARLRTYIGYAAFVVLEMAVLWMFHQERAIDLMKRILSLNSLDFEKYYSSLSLAYWMMELTLVLLGSIYFALVAGDIVAKESEDGNLRMVLARPVSRLRVLVLKYLAVLIYTVTFVWFVAISGYVMGSLVLGWDGGLFVWDYKMKVFAVYPNAGEGVGRLALAGFMLSLSLCTLSSIGFAFSCFNIKPAAATILALSILLVDWVLQKFPFAEPYMEHFLTYRIANWIYVLEHEIAWAKVAESYTFLFGLDLTLFVIGWMAFRVRDFKT